jgi:hypothetical protein
MWVLDGVPDWGGVKKYESWLLGPGLDLILFIVQLGATGPPRYTIIFGEDTTFLSMHNFIWINLLVKLCQFVFL